MLLAAGESRRMGRTKALLPHPDGSGRALLRAAVETLLAAGAAPVFVVLGHARREIAPELRGLEDAIRPVINPAYRSGMLSSLKAGIRAAAAAPEVGWALVALVDQPFLSARLIGRLAAAAAESDAPILAPRSAVMERQARFGHPVVFSRRLFSEILAEAPRRPEDEDRGAHRVVRRHRSEAAFLPAEERELATADTPADYERLRTPSGSGERPRRPESE